MKKILITFLFYSIINVVIFTSSDNTYNKKAGFNSRVSYSYYRRGYALLLDSMVPVNLYRGLYFEAGTMFALYKNSNSHFFAATNDVYGARHEGFCFALKLNLRYRFQVVPNFGIHLSTGAAFGPEFISAYNYVDLEDYDFFNLTLIPEISLGTYINYKNWVYDISISKSFPLILAYYHIYEKSWFTLANYFDSNILNPVRYICISAVSIDFGITYFFK